ncbi:DNA cytosine methyltransferase [Pseudonocardia sp. Ae505_Ps2]|uniref:DNA cytosine methyltransferase n=1 Tax=Pseudonocardia sp. Ae505_Ps2 TaxID=1885034 RepID=UPI00094E6F5F|nr:DNA cytosine methyltransferase [Pseudonocardia sp. Ae505_Ps2]
MTALRLVDLFAGCGGLTRGFLDANRDLDTTFTFEVVASVELDRAAAATYAANYGREHLFHGRIEDWPTSSIPAADIVVGGPPCQGFSNLGRRDPLDYRNRLWREYVRVVETVQPSYFVIENVAAFFKSPQWALLQLATGPDGPLRNYELQPYIRNAAEFGVPQLRKRAVVLGRHTSRDPLPEPRGRFAAQPESFATVRQALAGLPASVDPGHIDLPDEIFDFDGRSVPGAFKTAQLHVTRHFQPLSLERFAAIPEGGNRTDLPWELQTSGWRKHKTGSLDVMGRLHWGKPSVTIRTEFVKPEKGRYLHPSENRPLTLAEGAILQTFPLDYQWCGAKVSIARQIGNAVPVELGTALARLVRGGMT